MRQRNVDVVSPFDVALTFYYCCYRNGWHARYSTYVLQYVQQSTCRLHHQEHARHAQWVPVQAKCDVQGASSVTLPLACYHIIQNAHRERERHSRPVTVYDHWRMRWLCFVELGLGDRFLGLEATQKADTRENVYDIPLYKRVHGRCGWNNFAGVVSSIGLLKAVKLHWYIEATFMESPIFIVTYRDPFQLLFTVFYSKWRIR